MNGYSLLILVFCLILVGLYKVSRFELYFACKKAWKIGFDAGKENADFLHRNNITVASKEEIKKMEENK